MRGPAGEGGRGGAGVCRQDRTTRELRMRRIAEDLRSYASKDGSVLLGFRQETGIDALEETGFALVFYGGESAGAPYLSSSEEEKETILPRTEVTGS